MQNEILRQLKNAGVVPVVKIDFVDKAIPLAKALIAGGLSTIEITFRSDAAFGAIKALTEAKLKTQEGKSLLIGAGTVINAEIAKKAIDAGSQFLVSPGTNAKTIAYCRAESTPIIPGVSSASDIEGALEQGQSSKVFPKRSPRRFEDASSTSRPLSAGFFYANRWHQSSKLKSLCSGKIGFCHWR